MSSLPERIAQFHKMANDDPGNELGHFRLGQLYLEANQFEDAVKSLRRTLELDPKFAKAFQLLGIALVKLGRRDEAIRVLRDGFHVADERGNNLPRDEMAKLLVELGEPAPTSKVAAAPRGNPVGEGGFRCQRPGCTAGTHAHRLPRPPMNDEIGQRIYDTVCAECWEYWLRNLSIKVINEMRLDLSREDHQQMYDQLMQETLGLS